jgi:hypothetical protein
MARKRTIVLVTFTLLLLTALRPAARPAAGGLAGELLTPESWNVDTCAYAGGVGAFRGQLFNATEGTTAADVAFSVNGFGGFPATVTPAALPQMPAQTRFDVSVTVSVPLTAALPATGIYTGTLYAEGTGTNRLSWPLSLTLLDGNARCTKGQLVLDGVDDSATADDEPELDIGDEAAESLTVEARVLFSTFRAALIFAKQGAYALYTTEFASGTYKLRCLRFGIDSGQTTRTIESCVTPNGGRFWIPGWHHVAGVYDRATGEMRLYMDGQRLGSANQVGQILLDNSSTAASVGTALAGVMDEVRISTAVRYSGASYAVPAAAFGCDAATRGLWHFDELEGATRFHDACGTDNVLTGQEGAHAGGTPTWRVRVPLNIIP